MRDRTVATLLRRGVAEMEEIADPMVEAMGGEIEIEIEGERGDENDAEWRWRAREQWTPPFYTEPEKYKWTRFTTSARTKKISHAPGVQVYPIHRIFVTPYSENLNSR